jgi:eukaryotic-like serine/threonine-protein kinase
METFGHYTILERLRTSPLGELFRARDARLGRTVALRLVNPEVVADPARRDALLADAAAASTLSHPHVAALFDFGEEGGRIFLAHEFVPGQSLQTLLASARPFDVPLAIEFAVQLSDALAEAHRLGIVHGNIAPSTIFITPTDQAKVIDFGLAQWTTGGRDRAAIARELSKGAEPSSADAAHIVPYMSPEQVLSDRIDCRTDVFSLGAVLYEMLTGRPPFGSEMPGQTAMRILQDTPPPASTRNPDLPPGFDAILTRAMSKNLDARYATATAMAAELRRLAEQLHVRVTADVGQWNQPQTPKKPIGPLARRIAAGLLLAAVLGGGGAAAWRWRDGIGRLLHRRAAIANPVLVVMPFDTAGGETERAYYGIGFAEDLAARLGEVPGLTVVGRSMIAEPGALPLDARAKAVGASVALRGTTRPGPYSLHVDVELVDVPTGRVLWSQSYAREPRQASAAEVEIARRVADELSLQMPTGNRWERALVRQVDPGAYDFYLQARDAAARRDRGRAITLYEQATGLDPRLVEARVGLSEALYLEDFYSGSSGDGSALDRARAEAEGALAVDSEMPRAHIVAALSAPTISVAASSLSRALSLDPSNGEAWHHAGDLVIELDPERAIGLYRHSLRLEPGNDASHRDIAAAYEALGRLPEAEAALSAGQAARPDRPWWTQLLARLEVVRQNYDMAVELLKTPSTESSPSAWLFGRVASLKMAGRDVEAAAEVRRLIERYPGYCDAQAIAAGLDWDANNKVRARATVDSILASASAPGAKPALAQCAATAAAAIGDGPQAASIFIRMASDERVLRAWARQTVFNLAFAFRVHLYPWNKVQASGPMNQAAAALAESLARLKDETARRLPTPAVRPK